MAAKRRTSAAQRIRRDSEPLDRAVAEALEDREPAAGPASILVIGREGPQREALVACLENVHHRCICVGRLDTARATATRGRFDLLLIDPVLPDGDGLELARHLRQAAPYTRCIVYGDGRGPDDALNALRAGAVDVLAGPLDEARLLAAVQSAAAASRRERQREERVARLKRVCKELNVARREITEQVDILCKDLVNAYQDMAEQMNEVALSSEFKTLLRQELDVEDLLRTALQYMLTKTGPTNAAVFLPDAEGHYGLGAYVNYDCPRESVSVLLDHLCRSICPQMAREREIVSFEDAEEFGAWINADVDLLEDSQVIALSCRHGGDCMAVVVLFRRKCDPFQESLAGTLDTMRVIFAEQLAQIIKVHHRAAPSWPKDAWEDGDEYGDDRGIGGFEGGLAA